MTPMILYEDYPFGNWTYVYWFGEIKMGEGWFIVHEAVDDYLGTGVSDLNESENAIDQAVSAFHEQLDIYMTNSNQSHVTSIFSSVLRDIGA